MVNGQIFEKAANLEHFLSPGRVVTGWLGDLPEVNAHLLYNFFLFASGLSVLCFILCENYVSFVVVALAIGMDLSLWKMFEHSVNLSIVCFRLFHVDVSVSVLQNSDRSLRGRIFDGNFGVKSLRSRSFSNDR